MSPKHSPDLLRTLVLCALLLATASVALAGPAEAASTPLRLRELIGWISFGALGGMLAWHLRK